MNKKSMKSLFNISLFSFFILFNINCKTESDKSKTDVTLIEESTVGNNALEYNPSQLLSESKQFINIKDFPNAKSKLQVLIEKHPNSKEADEARLILPSLQEELAWHYASTFDEPSYVNDYLENYPLGKYVSQAKKRVIELKKKKFADDLNEAQSKNTSYSWQKFIDTYPDYPSKKEIKEKIIRLKVAEIASNSETGQIPDFVQTGGGYTSVSTVTIKNDTGCELSIWYSGENAKLIEIPIGGTESVSLTSGSYNIAASACGSNYSGKEVLNGKYNSTFYIRTTRY